MVGENVGVKKIREALAKDYALLSYNLPYKSNIGYLETDEEEHISDIAKRELEDKYKVKEETYATVRAQFVWYLVKSRKVV